MLLLHAYLSTSCSESDSFQLDQMSHMLQSEVKKNLNAALQKPYQTLSDTERDDFYFTYLSHHLLPIL